MSEQLLGRAANEVIGRVGAVASFAAGIIHQALVRPGPDEMETRYQLGEMDVPRAETYQPKAPELAYTIRLADESPLTLTPSNTALVTCGNEPYLDHVRVTRRAGNERTVYRFYENPELIAELARREEEFPLDHISRVTIIQRKQYADWVARQQPPDAVESFIGRVLSPKK